MSETLDITSLKLEQKNAAIKNLKIARMKSKLLKKNKNIKQVILDNSTEKYIFTTKEGKTFITEPEVDEEKLLEKINTENINTDSNIVKETNLEKVIEITGEKVVKQTFGKKYGYVFIGNGGCYGVNAGQFYDIGSSEVKEIKLYNIRGWGDLWWDKRFISDPAYYAGAASPTVSNNPYVSIASPAHNYTDFTQQYKTNPALYKKHNFVNKVFNSDKFVDNGGAFKNTGCANYQSIASLYNTECFDTTYSKNYFKKPFVNLRIPYIVTNSNKAMRKYKNNENIVVLSAYDNWEQTTFLNPTHENSATHEIKSLYNGQTSLIYGYSLHNKREIEEFISIEFTRTLTPKYQTTYPILPNKDSKEFIYKGELGWPGRIIEDKPIKMRVGSISSLNNIQTQNARYGTRFNAIFNKSANKFIGILPDGITAQSWTGRGVFNNKTVANQQTNIKEWNSANTSFSDPNKAFVPVWKYFLENSVDMDILNDLLMNGGGKPLIKFTRKINVNIDFPEELGFETLNFTIEEDFEEKDDDIISINDIISKIPNDRKQNYIFNNTTDQTTDTRGFKGLSFKENNEIINSINLRDIQDSFSLKCIFKDIKRIKTIQVDIQNIYAPGVGSKMVSYQYDLLDKTTYYKNVEDIIKSLPESTRNKNDYVTQDDYGNRYHYIFQDIQLNGSSLKQLNLSTSGNVVGLNCIYNQTGIDYYWKIVDREVITNSVNNRLIKYHRCTYYNNILNFIQKDYLYTQGGSSTVDYPTYGYNLHVEDGH